MDTEKIINSKFSIRKSDSGEEDSFVLKTGAVDSSSNSFVSTEIQYNFFALLPKDERIERVYWAFDQQLLRIWTVIDRPDFEFEKKIYDTQLKFMDNFPELECDFLVIYRFGKEFDRIIPSSAIQILS